MCVSYLVCPLLLGSLRPWVHARGARSAPSTFPPPAMAPKLSRKGRDKVRIALVRLCPLSYPPTRPMLTRRLLYRPCTSSARKGRTSRWKVSSAPTLPSSYARPDRLSQAWDPIRLHHLPPASTRPLWLLGRGRKWSGRGGDDPGAEGGGGEVEAQTSVPTYLLPSLSRDLRCQRRPVWVWLTLLFHMPYRSSSSARRCTTSSTPARAGDTRTRPADGIVLPHAVASAANLAYWTAVWACAVLWCAGEGSQGAGSAAARERRSQPYVTEVASTLPPPRSSSYPCLTGSDVLALVSCSSLACQVPQLYRPRYPPSPA